jgi:hypothetical protein
MPRQSPKLILAALRVSEARRIVTEQNMQIARLEIAGEPTHDAKRALQSYESALKHLEAHERRLRGAARQNARDVEAVTLIRAKPEFHQPIPKVRTPPQSGIASGRRTTVRTWSTRPPLAKVP